MHWVGEVLYGVMFIVRYFGLPLGLISLLYCSLFCLFVTLSLLLLSIGFAGMIPLWVGSLVVPVLLPKSVVLAV